MTKFNLESSGLDSMEYDFNEWGVPAKGTIPEPSQKAFRKFSKELSAVRRQLGRAQDDLNEIEKPTDEQVEEFTKLAEKIEDELNQHIAKLCQDLPSVEILEKLPYRVKIGFSGWLLEQFSPEAKTSGTKA